MKHPKYSIIIPIYNAKKTLCRCIDSLLDQNFHDAEIILVNDGSSDGSEQICLEYVQKSEQIKYIPKPNGGVSSARNTGLDAATGEYILFVDSDDYVAKNYFRMLETIDKDSNYDFLMFSSFRINGQVSRMRILSDFSADKTGAVMQKFSEALYRKTLNTPWNKRYKLCIIQENMLRFHNQISIGEDTLFNLQYALHCCSCLISSHPLYYVNVENTDSLSRKLRTDLDAQSTLLRTEIHRTIQNADIDEIHRAYFRAAENFTRFRSIYATAKRMHREGISASTRLKQIGRMCDELNKQDLKIPPSKYCKLICLLVKLRLSVLIDFIAWRLAN